MITTPQYAFVCAFLIIQYVFYRRIKHELKIIKFNSKREIEKYLKNIENSVLEYKDRCIHILEIVKIIQQKQTDFDPEKYNQLYNVVKCIEQKQIDLETITKTLSDSKYKLITH